VISSNIAVFWSIDNDTIEDYIGIRTCEIASKIIDAGLGEDEARALEPLFDGGGWCPL